MTCRVFFSIRLFPVVLIAGLFWLSTFAYAVPFDAVLNSITSHPSDPAVFYGASVGGVLRSDDAGATWVQKPMFPLGQHQPFVQEVLFDNANPSTIYAYANGLLANPLVGAWRSHDRGETWEQVISAETFDDGSTLSALFVAPSNGSVLYALTTVGGVQRIHRSDNGGSTWVYKGSGRIMAVHPKNADYVYDVSRATLRLSTNGGQSWMTAGTVADVSGTTASVNALAISPADAKIMIATISSANGNAQGIYRTVNGGGFWQRVKTGNSIGVKFSQGNPMEVISGDCCVIGAYYSSNAGATFASLPDDTDGYDSHPALAISRTSFDYRGTGRFLVAVRALGKGGVGQYTLSDTVWKRLPGTYTPSAVFSENPPSVKVLKGDTSQLSATLKIVGGEGGSAEPFVIDTPRVEGSQLAVDIKYRGDEENATSPVVVVRRNGVNAEPGVHQLRATIPVQGARNTEVFVDTALEVVDRPESAGVYLGNMIKGSKLYSTGSIISAAYHNGTFYYSTWGAIYAVQPNGTSVRIAGTPTSGYSGDGGPAIDASIETPYDLSIAPDGSIYFREGTYHVVRKIAPDGIITTVIGGPGVSSTSITEGQNALTVWPSGPITVRKDGTLLLAQRSAIWRLDGSVLRKVTGGGTTLPADGVNAGSATIYAVKQMTVDEADRIVLIHGIQLYRIEKNGTMKLLAGADWGNSDNSSTDVRKHALDIPFFAHQNGYSYYLDEDRNVIRRINPDFTVEDVAFNGSTGVASSCSGARYVPIDESIDASGLVMTGPNTLTIAGRGLPTFWLPAPGSSSIASPEVPSNGIVHAASFKQRIAPGSLISIFGTDVSNEQMAAQNLPLPAQLGGSVACIDGRVAPVLFASPGQVNVQMPYGVEPGARQARFFNRSGGGGAVPLNVQATAPDAFRADNGRGIAINPDGSLNGPGVGAAPGEYVVVYLTGIGEVEPAVEAGAAALVDPLSLAKAETHATIGGKSANLYYVGLTPGYAGLAQANIQVPDLPPGEHAVEIRIGDQINEPFTLAVK